MYEAYCDNYPTCIFSVIHVFIGNRKYDAVAGIICRQSFGRADFRENLLRLCMPYEYNDDTDRMDFKEA